MKSVRERSRPGQGPRELAGGRLLLLLTAADDKNRRGDRDQTFDWLASGGLLQSATSPEIKHGESHLPELETLPAYPIFVD
ncbi:unnamed protein product [Linum trigynum]|uniref:Uncharacterized protein n=1 Tax=Linum trigynum TaxID=586398 RepID=A0AAV2D704_9ROSI